MTRRAVQVLAAIVAGLVLLLVVLDANDPSRPDAAGQLLLPEFRAAANELTGIQITLPDDGGEVSIVREDDTWRVRERDGYPADVGMLRQLIVATAEARILEVKTSKPENYGRLGVDDPADGGAGTRIGLLGPGIDYTVIFGDSAQGDARYARLAGNADSFLVDRDPDLPKAAIEWLDPDIVDIPAAELREVVISHADGETVTVSKTEREQTDFVLSGIPEGRKLSYATIGNSVAGSLSGLELEDVRPAIDAPAATTAVFRGWDGMVVTARVVEDEDARWVEFAAAAKGDDDAVRERAAGINDRIAGWQYRLPEYRTDQLTRRWEDLLAPVDADE